jgi:predicted  nucleic acid-binding Zn-ribbon protein
MSGEYEQELWPGQKPVTVEEAMESAADCSQHPQICPNGNEMKALAQEIVDLRDSLEKMKDRRDGAENRIKHLEAGISAAKNALGLL